MLNDLLEAESREKTAKISTNPKAFFVHVRLPDHVTENLREVQKRVLPDTEQHAEIDHVTLVYTQKPLEDHPSDKVHAALSALRQVGENAEPIHAKIQGWGYFDGAATGGKTNTALVALLDAPGLEHLHVDMSRALKTLGIDPSDKHVFTPHITFGYLGDKGRAPGDLPPINASFTIDKAHVASRDHHEIPLVGVPTSVGQKAAASALRSRIQMQQAGGKTVATLFGKPIGALNVDDGHVSGAAIDPAFQGMGLGKKLYGETIRRQPETTLRSDPHGTSESAQRVWAGMQARPGYNVAVTPGWENRGTSAAPRYRPSTSLKYPEAPHIFSASLPAAAQLPRAPRASPDVREGVNQLFESAHIGGGSRPSPDPFHARINMRAKAASIAYHGSPKVGSFEIAMDHLTEDPMYYDKLEKFKIAARRGMELIRGHVAAGNLGAANRLATTPGVLKPSAAGSQIRHIGSGMEGTSTLTAHPEHGIEVRKTYDPQGISGPEMVANKERAGIALRDNKDVAQFHRAIPTQIGPAHFSEYVQGAQPARGKVPPSIPTDPNAIAARVRASGSAAGMHMHDVHSGNIVGNKVVDYLPVPKGGGPSGLRTGVMDQADAAAAAHNLGVNHAFTNYLKDPARPGNLMGQAFRGAKPLVQEHSPPQHPKWASLGAEAADFAMNPRDLRKQHRDPPGKGTTSPSIGGVPTQGSC